MSSWGCECFLVTPLGVALRIAAAGLWLIFRIYCVLCHWVQWFQSELSQLFSVRCGDTLQRKVGWVVIPTSDLCTLLFEFLFLLFFKNNSHLRLCCALFHIYISDRWVPQDCCFYEHFTSIKKRGLVTKALCICTYKRTVELFLSLQKNVRTWELFNTTNHRSYLWPSRRQTFDESSVF